MFAWENIASSVDSPTTNPQRPTDWVEPGKEHSKNSFFFTIFWPGIFTLQNFTVIPNIIYLWQVWKKKLKVKLFPKFLSEGGWGPPVHQAEHSTVLQVRAVWCSIESFHMPSLKRFLKYLLKNCFFFLQVFLLSLDLPFLFPRGLEISPPPRLPCGWTLYTPAWARYRPEAEYAEYVRFSTGDYSGSTTPRDIQTREKTLEKSMFFLLLFLFFTLKPFIM